MGVVCLFELCPWLPSASLALSAAGFSSGPRCCAHWSPPRWSRCWRPRPAGTQLRAVPVAPLCIDGSGCGVLSFWFPVLRALVITSVVPLLAPTSCRHSAPCCVRGFPPHRWLCLRCAFFLVPGAYRTGHPLGGPAAGAHLLRALSSVLCQWLSSASLTQSAVCFLSGSRCLPHWSSPRWSRCWRPPPAGTQLSDVPVAPLRTA